MVSEEQSLVRRILVATDASEQSLSMLETALGLAERLGAQLDTLFIEDADLLAWAGLPFTRAFDQTSGVERRIDTGEVEKTLKSRIARAREKLTSASSGRNVQISFQVTRGHYLSTALEARGERDVLMLCSISSWSYRADQLATVAARASDMPVSVIYTGSPAAKRALNLAVELAVEHNAPVQIWTSGTEVQDAAQAYLREQRVTVERSVHTLPSAPEQLADVLANLNCRALVLPEEFSQPSARQELLRRLRCPALLIS